LRIAGTKKRENFPGSAPRPPDERRGKEGGAVGRGIGGGRRREAGEGGRRGGEKGQGEGEGVGREGEGKARGPRKTLIRPWQGLLGLEPEHQSFEPQHPGLNPSARLSPRCMLQDHSFSYLYAISNNINTMLNFLIHKLRLILEKMLDSIFSAIVISRITYAIKAWGSYVTAEQVGKIDKMCKKARKWVSVKK
jgi:hypothetical protein